MPIFLICRILFILSIDDDNIGETLALDSRFALCVFDVSYQLPLDDSFLPINKILGGRCSPDTVITEDMLKSEILKLLYNVLLQHGRRHHGDDPTSPFIRYISRKIQ